MPKAEAVSITRRSLAATAGFLGVGAVGRLPAAAAAADPEAIIWHELQALMVPPDPRDEDEMTDAEIDQVERDDERRWELIVQLSTSAPASVEGAARRLRAWLWMYRDNGGSVLRDELDLRALENVVAFLEGFASGQSRSAA